MTCMVIRTRAIGVSSAQSANRLIHNLVQIPVSFGTRRSILIRCGWMDSIWLFLSMLSTLCVMHRRSRKIRCSRISFISLLQELQILTMPRQDFFVMHGMSQDPCSGAILKQVFLSMHGVEHSDGTQWHWSRCLITSRKLILDILSS